MAVVTSTGVRIAVSGVLRPGDTVWRFSAGVVETTGAKYRLAGVM
jgi:hypothetical protein